MLGFVICIVTNSGTRGPISLIFGGHLPLVVGYLHLKFHPDRLNRSPEIVGGSTLGRIL